MRTVLFACIVLVLPLPVMGTPADTIDVRLEDHQWEHRLLFVFAPSDASGARAEQEAAFEEHDPGFRERDLLILTVMGPSKGTQRAAPAADPQPLTEAAARRLRDRFDVPEDAFRVVLVGKDGTEKRRDPEPVTARSIFDTIDAMPMRQREMREQDGGGE
ncbi:DUF4174 domain-containing protein [Salinibacter grassmerensis]|uniref:DUF4174 domain-containing protein n=1 Tax=Salinibacter grassmerensis TaxID=3040353 RepID=UPI0021E88CF1|nr:DUF4174 domain-containing protein [Salinibacter grassmerensis]